MNHHHSADALKQTALLPCPFCNGASRIVSNRDWHRLYADHTDDCVLDADEADLMFPAQPGYLIEIVEVWNRRPTPAVSPDLADLRNRVRIAVAESLGDTYYCGRTWSAWGVGTMDDSDFTPADECDEVLDGAADAVMEVIMANNRALLDRIERAEAAHAAMSKQMSEDWCPECHARDSAPEAAARAVPDDFDFAAEHEAYRAWMGTVHPMAVSVQTPWNGWEARAKLMGKTDQTKGGA